MRVVYYFNPDDAIKERVDRILGMYDSFELVRVFDQSFADLKLRYNVPSYDTPHLLVIHNGIVEGIWNF